MVAVSELVSGLDAELVRLGYKPSTMVWYRGCWRRLERFFASRGVREFSLDVAMAWVDQASGGFFDKEQAGTLKPTDVYLFRVAAMLDDFAAHRAVLRKWEKPETNSTRWSWIPSRRSSAPSPTAAREFACSILIEIETLPPSCISLSARSRAVLPRGPGQ